MSKKCPPNLLEALQVDTLDQQQQLELENHLSRCTECRDRLQRESADISWWQEAGRLLDPAELDLPDEGTPELSFQIGDQDSLKEDPIAELRSAGIIEPPHQADVLGQLGRYAIERELGSGGMGVVLKGYDSDLNRTVAIKVVAPHLARSGAARQRFVREARAAAAVVHENIVAIHEVDTSMKLPLLVMRYVDGVSLQSHVDTHGPLPLRDVLRIAAQAAAGLAAAHRQGIVHRDVKPGNILVGAAGQRIWITDFGLARAVDDASLTRTGFIAGTPHYMSPEQARGDNVLPRSDLFSLGGVIYFMLTGRPPWRAERSLAVLHRIVSEPHRPLWEINPDVPRELVSLVDQLLSKDPLERSLPRPSPVSNESDSLPRIDAEDVQHHLEAMLSELQSPTSPHSLQASGMARPTARRTIWSRPWFTIPITATFTASVMMAGFFLLARYANRTSSVTTSRKTASPQNAQPSQTTTPTWQRPTSNSKRSKLTSNHGERKPIQPQPTTRRGMAISGSLSPSSSFPSSRKSPFTASSTMGLPSSQPLQSTGQDAAPMVLPIPAQEQADAADQDPGSVIEQWSSTRGHIALVEALLAPIEQRVRRQANQTADIRTPSFPSTQSNP
ncbi:MAG: serine/threonine-protein kinase [Planctomycetota bacterium]